MSQWDMAMVVMAVMEGEAADLVADLYGDHVVELGDIGLFLAVLQGRFEYITRTQQAEGELLTIQEWRRPVSKYIREFWQLASKVHGWLEWLVVHHFKVGLDWTLRWACACRGLPPRLTVWFQAAMELDIEFQED